jgi:hypothetical protein
MAVEARRQIDGIAICHLSVTPKPAMVMVNVVRGSSSSLTCILFLIQVLSQGAIGCRCKRSFLIAVV